MFVNHVGDGQSVMSELCVSAHTDNGTYMYGLADDLYNHFGDYQLYSDDMPGPAENFFPQFASKENSKDLVIAKPAVKCKPLPGWFMLLLCLLVTKCKCLD